MVWRALLKILSRQGPRVLFIKLRNKLNQRYQYKRYLSSTTRLEKNGENLKRNIAEAFQFRPKVSIIVPVFNTDERWLKLCIESVLNQVYDNWELCVVDGNSQKPYIKRVLGYFAQHESRIKVKLLPENGGIAGNSNEALSISTGEFVCFLDHDDELSPEALYQIVKLLNENPDLDFIYTDEDKITSKGKRVDPHFKPDWSPDTLYSCNYITHLSAIRKDVIDRLGGFRNGYDGSQDYDLFLRVTEITNKIAHIPKVLYHWRMIPRSAASSSDAKPYAYIAAKKAISDSLKRKKIESEVLDGPAAGFYRVKYKLLGNPTVSIIISTRNEVKALQRCIQSVLDKSEYDNYEILLVDDQRSGPENLRYEKRIKENQKIRIIKYDESFSDSKIYNRAVSRVDSEYIIFLSNATEVISCEWLTAMLEHVQREEVGIAGALLYYPNNTIQHAGVIIGMVGVAGHSHRYLFRKNPGYINRVKIIQNLSAVTGACMMIKRSLFEKVGGFDELFQLAFNDIDLCLKIREKGYLCVYTPYAELYLHESPRRENGNTQKRSVRFKREIEYFQAKWKDVLSQGDPYYNPNLTLEREDFSIRR